jgi:transposase
VPAGDTGVALVITRLDTAAMNLFLAKLSAVAPRAHGIVLMEKAGWHTASDFVVPANLSLVFLPPYSPELNPIETAVAAYARQSPVTLRIPDHRTDHRHLLQGLELAAR